VKDFTIVVGAEKVNVVSALGEYDVAATRPDAFHWLSLRPHFPSSCSRLIPETVALAVADVAPELSESTETVRVTEEYLTKETAWVADGSVVELN
jgi:hypothetical protein